MLNITYKDRRTNIWVRERTKLIDIIYNVEKNEMVLSRAYQPPQRVPMDLARHHLDTIMTRKDDKGDQPIGGEMTWTNTGATRFEDSKRQGHLETTCRGLRPTTGHNGCLMMNDDDCHHECIIAGVLKVVSTEKDWCYSLRKAGILKTSHQHKMH